MSENVIIVSDASFEADILQSEMPVVLDFWAGWCNPCKMIAPIIDDVAGDYAGKVIFAKINVEENSDTPTKYGVHGIPTLILFKNGEAVATHAGALTKSQLTAFIDTHI